MSNKHELIILLEQSLAHSKTMLENAANAEWEKMDELEMERQLFLAQFSADKLLSSDLEQAHALIEEIIKLNQQVVELTTTTRGEHYSAIKDNRSNNKYEQS